jgi:ABC-type Zn uptake system ZnuABC Zn-binding protein ZnuA
VVEDIVAALARVSPEDEALFRTNADSYLGALEKQIRRWEETMKPFTGRKIITFHKSWTYFADWLGLEVAGQVEPKPGIPPSPSHSAELIQLIRAGTIKAIVVEPFYDMTAPEQIAGASSAKVVRLATSSGGVEEANDYISLMDYNIRTLAAALR